MSYRKDFQDANADFSLFSDALAKALGGGEIVDVESSNCEIAKLIDTQAGVDAVQVKPQGIRPLAIRAQWVKDYQTFTIRFSRSSGAETEYSKRIRAVMSNSGLMYPHITVQAYMDERGDPNRIMSCGIVRTDALYRYIAPNIMNVKRNKCPEGNEFLYVKFNELIRNGVNVHIIRSEALPMAANA